MKKICIDIAVSMNDYLIEIGKRDGSIKAWDDMYTTFTDEELSMVKDLVITNSYNIDDLSMLPNLECLVIKSADYNEILGETNIEYSHVINHISDFSIIASLPNLKKLNIINDLHVKELDISKLDKLESLILVNNPLLETVKGLDKLHNLHEVIMYGNNINGDNLDINAYLEQTLLSYDNTLDISMYLGIIKKDKSWAQQLANAEIGGYSFLRFGEKSGFLKYVCLSPRDLCDMYCKLNNWFTSKKAYDLNSDDKLAFVYSYIIKNVKFSKQLIINRDTNYQSIKEKYIEIPNRVVKTLNNFHSSYYAYHFKQSNCEGIVNLMVLMLRMLDIPAWNVHCHDKRASQLGNNHALVRVKLNDDYYYIDPSYDRKNVWQHFLMDYEATTEYVDLDVFEYSLYKDRKKKEYVKKNTQA